MDYTYNYKGVWVIRVIYNYGTAQLKLETHFGSLTIVHSFYSNHTSKLTCYWCHHFTFIATRTLHFIVVNNMNWPVNVCPSASQIQRSLLTLLFLRQYVRQTEIKNESSAKGNNTYLQNLQIWCQNPFKILTSDYYHVIVVILHNIHIGC